MIIPNYYYKDIQPTKTLEIIQDQLKKLNLDVTETWIDSGISNIFSLRVTIRSVNLNTFGKGCTKEFARASAYAELIERLANFILVNPYLYKKFNVYPDSKIFSLESFLDNEEQLWGNIEETLTLLNKTYNNNNKDIYCIPFKNIINNNIYWFPSFFFPFISSNGMGAGNTFEELAVQSISEIFERYCIKNIFSKNPVLPLIDLKKLLKEYPLLIQIKEDIEKKGNEVIVRDCSLDTSLPVYCVVISKPDNTFSIAFGSHPNFEYAIERCFTEVLQGTNISNLKNNKNRKSINSYFNLLGIFGNGIGVYPEIFFETSVYVNNYEPYLKNYKSNKDMLNYYKLLIKKNNMNVYYYDNSYLGLYSGQFFSPNVSDVFKPTSDFPIEFINKKKELDYLFDNFEKGTIQDQQLFVHFYDYCLQYNFDIKNKELKSQYNLSSVQNLILFIGVKSMGIGETELGIKYLSWLYKNNKNSNLNTEIEEILKNSDNINYIRALPLYSIKLQYKTSFSEEKLALFEKLMELKKKSQRIIH